MPTCWEVAVQDVAAASAQGIHFVTANSRLPHGLPRRVPNSQGKEKPLPKSDSFGLP